MHACKVLKDHVKGVFVSLPEPYAGRRVLCFKRISAYSFHRKSFFCFFADVREFRMCSFVQVIVANEINGHDLAWQRSRYQTRFFKHGSLPPGFTSSRGIVLTTNGLSKVEESGVECFVFGSRFAFDMCEYKSVMERIQGKSGF